MNDSQHGLLTGALLGDALALWPHWIYDAHEIEKIFGDFDDYTDPAKNPYHKTKKIGDFTHYGDQMMILIFSIRQEGSYNPAKYLTAWRESMKQYTGYMDHASKITLETGQGSDSFDWSPLWRIAPLLSLETTPTDTTISDFVGFTHNHPVVKSWSIFIAHVIATIQSGKTPTLAIQEAMSDSSDIVRFRDEALASREQDTQEAIQKFGQSCWIDGVFQWAIHCILKYENDFKKALLENTKAGGDSAARGMIIGMVLWAYTGYERLPKDWLETMNAKV